MVIKASSPGQISVGVVASSSLCWSYCLLVRDEQVAEHDTQVIEEHRAPVLFGLLGV